MQLQLLKSIARSMELRDATPEEIGGEAMNLGYGSAFLDAEDYEFAIIFNVKIVFEEKHLDVEYMSIFKTDSVITQEFKDSHFVKVNAPAIAFPFVRSYIAHLSLIGGYKPMILPSFNFVERAKEDATTPVAV
jgi:preprotein translocase subunit SecB